MPLQEPFLIADFVPPDKKKFAELNPDLLAAQKAFLGFTADHFEASDISIGESGTFFFKSSVAIEQGPDLLGPYLDAARARGIQVLIYFNVHWYAEHFKQLHPLWLQQDVKGELIPAAYGSGYYNCVNSTWRDWSLQVIRDLGSYPIAGIFLDGPIFNLAGCYCPVCRQLFQEETGTQPPEKPVWGISEGRAWAQFREQSIARYLKDARKALQEVNTQAVIYMNGNLMSPDWGSARSNRLLAPYQDILGAEGGFLGQDLRQIPLWRPGATAKLLATQAEGKPTVVFLAGRHSPWSRYFLSSRETELLLCQTVAHGANPWYGIYLEHANEAGTEPVRKFNHFIKANREYYQETKPIAPIALLWSSGTVNYYNSEVVDTDFTQGKAETRRDVCGNYSKAFHGYYDALVRGHMPFAVIDEEAIAKGELDKYQALVMPNCACLGDAVIEKIASFVENGGTLVASLGTSSCNQFGEKRDQLGLAEVLGISWQGSFSGPFSFDHLFLQDKHESFPWPAGSAAIPAPPWALKVEAKGAQTLLAYRQKAPARYAEIPPASQQTAICEHRFGKGKAIYLAGNFDELYYDYQLDEIRKVLLWPLAEVELPVVAKGLPQSVEVVPRKQKERLIVHLINYTGEMTRPIRELIPLTNLELSFPRLSGVGKVRTLSLGKELEHEITEEGITFTLPTLNTYEVLVLEDIEIML